MGRACSCVLVLVTPLFVLILIALHLHEIPYDSLYPISYPQPQPWPRTVPPGRVLATHPSVYPSVVSRELFFGSAIKQMSIN